MNTDVIQRALQPLVGLPFRSIGRTTNMLWLHFGEMREVNAWRDEKKSVGDWAIHVQCSWRLCQQGRIKVAHRDYYCNPNGEPLDDWDTHGNSQFDRMAAILNSELETGQHIVQSYSCDDVGGFSLMINNDCRFDVFPNESTLGESAEFWRLFKPASDEEHFVV